MKTLYQVRYQTKNIRHNDVINVVADSPSEAIEKVDNSMDIGSSEHQAWEGCKKQERVQVIALAKVHIT